MDWSEYNLRILLSFTFFMTLCNFITNYELKIMIYLILNRERKEVKIDYLLEWRKWYKLLISRALQQCNDVSKKKKKTKKIAAWGDR